MSKTTFCLDLGTLTGWACMKDGVITSGREEFKNGRFSGGGMRFLRFGQWLEQIKQAVNPDVVYYEEVRRHLGVDAAHAFGGFMSHLTAFCEKHSIPYQGVPVGTIKKKATGRGNADKQSMIEWAKSAGFNPGCDNEADALAILHWARSENA